MNTFSDLEAVYVDGTAASELIATTFDSLADAGLISLSVDFISYTEDFERIYERVRSVFPLTRNEVFTRLMNKRKQGECPAPNGPTRKRNSK